MKITGLKKSYGTNAILKGIDLEIRSGEFVSLLGPSGSGKTTILRCIAGLEKPDAESGEMLLGEKRFSDQGFFLPPEKRNLGMVFQNYAVWPHLDVFENVAFPLRIRVKKNEMKLSELEIKVRESIELVKLKGLEKRFAHELSGGQQQRVALARALAMSPDALLLDEPLSNLDALLRDELGAEIRRLQQKLKLTTILVTHDRKEALSLSDRIIVLNHGKIEADGTPESLYLKPPTPFVAEFISDAQKTSQGHFLPRKWKVGRDGTRIENVTIVNRVFLGNEYEYWGESQSFTQPIRFYHPQKLEVGVKSEISYLN